MPRPKRSDVAGCIYHALNRGNARSDIFLKDGDYEAFERILAEGLERYDVELLAYCLLPNHWSKQRVLTSLFLQASGRPMVPSGKSQITS